MENNKVLLDLVMQIHEKIDNFQDKMDNKLTRVEDRINDDMSSFQKRLDSLEDDVSRAKGWGTAAISVVGVVGAFVVEWFRRQMIG